MNEWIEVISKLPNDKEKFIALFNLLGNEYKEINNSIYCESKRYDFGPKTQNITKIESL